MASAGAPSHSGGTGTSTASHGSGYMQPAIGVGAKVLSCTLNHPFPDTIGFPFVSVNVGGGRVEIAPVGV